MRNIVSFWLILVVFVFAMVESLASLYYFQRGNFDYSLASVQLFHGLKTRLIKSGVIKPTADRHFVNDERFGWLPRGETQKGMSADFCERMNSPASLNGGQALLDPNDSVGRILFVGGSFTAGYGVKCNEAYPQILAKEYWPKWEVHNMAVSGFGTHQAYMRLADAMKSDRPPSVVIYGMILDHVRRNYLSREWLESLAPRKLPHFELTNGELVFQGTVGPSSGIENGSELRKKELEMTIAYINAMQKICMKRNIPFIVIFLPPSPKFPPDFLYEFYKLKILFLDLGLVEFEGLSSKDRHPNVMDNRRIAAAIQNSFVSVMLRNIEIQSTSQGQRPLFQHPKAPG